jgi:ribonucleoside-diphosphate reductase alpha chain
MKTAVETGMPYVFFRDTVNAVNPNKHVGNVYSTQLCTEICQNTSPTKFVEEKIEDGKIVITYEPGDVVVCNLASINVAKVYEESVIADVVSTVMRVLDNVITLNYYPIKEAERTAMKYRSVGLGYLGLAEYLATRKIAYETKQAREEVDRLFEMYTYHTYRTSADLAIERGPYHAWEGSEYSKGILLGRKQGWFTQKRERGGDWKRLFTDMKKTGLRFGYHTAPAPNTSTAGVVGTTAALLPIYKRYFVETNLSAPTVRVAPQLDKENYWYYKEYVSMDMNDVIDMMSVIYKWVDQSISFEWMIDPARTSPEQLYGYYMHAWEKKIKTVYYVRSLSGEVQKSENVCVSCSG